MPEQCRFAAAYPYQGDILALPVTDLDAAARWYTKGFGLREVERNSEPLPTVILERDGIRLGFCVNGGDASQSGAAILVSGVENVRRELEGNGVRIANWRIDERDGQKLQVFFVVAPDGLCFYFHEPI
jgi:catechol 2,3-dioxygenase-like lactoylglutathione lyase family enzyme